MCFRRVADVQACMALTQLPGPICPGSSQLREVNLWGCAQVGAEYWGKASEELQLHVFKGYLCTGCMDKAQYGRHGLLHSVQVLPWAARVSRRICRVDQT